MTKLVKIFAVILIVIHLGLAAWYVIHQDVYFNTDIARDFLLYGEIDRKKLILIGPRSSTGGLFHGPLWLYLTYPGYLLGQGNPVAVGWYWIFLIADFLAGSFWVAKKLFGDTTAYVYTVLLSMNMIFQARGLFNPHGALFLMPVFLFTIVRYLETKKQKYLAAHTICTGLIIQFQMAIGLPLALLSVVLLVPFIIRQKLISHFLTFLLLGLILSNFFIFDVRHGFNMFKSLLLYISPQQNNHFYNYLGMIDNRIHFTLNMQLVENPSWNIVLVIFAVTAVFFILGLREEKFRLKYRLFLYFYLGYMLLTFVNKGGILIHQFFPMFALTFLIVASFVATRFGKIALICLVILYMWDLQIISGYINYANLHFIGIDVNSWKFLHKLSDTLYSVADQKFGYFVYTPDAFAYEPRYALIYGAKHTGKQVSEYVKKPVTYMIAAPHPPGNPYMKDEWWRVNELKIDKNPVSAINFSNGYKIERYELNSQEMAVPFDPNIILGIHFR